MRCTEAQLHHTVVDYLNLVHPTLLWWHTNNNAGFGSVKAGKKAKRLGVLAGVPDLFIAHPSSKHHGLFVELKVGKGYLSRQQKKIIGQLRSNGYRVIIARSLDDIITELEKLDHG